MVAKTARQLRPMSDEELAEYMAGWKEQSANYMTSMSENVRVKSVKVNVSSCVPPWLRAW